MWNWLIAGLATKATIVLYDGSPFSRGAKTLWEMCEQDDWSIFGTSAKYISALEKQTMHNCPFELDRNSVA